jgi:hypothetical protein
MADGISHQPCSHPISLQPSAMIADRRQAFRTLLNSFRLNARVLAAPATASPRLEY